MSGVYDADRTQIVYALEIKDRNLNIDQHLLVEGLDAITFGLHGMAGNEARNLLQTRRSLVILYAAGDYETAGRMALEAISAYHPLRGKHNLVQWSKGNGEE